MEILTDSAQETKQVAKVFAKKLKAGDIVALYGDLGTGKTTFVQGLAQGLGITKRILSPSFVFVRQYAVRNMRYANLYHVDLYRLEDEKRAEGLGLKEIFLNKNSIVVIEWADKIKKLLLARRIEINFSYGEGENQRRISVKRRD